MQEMCRGKRKSRSGSQPLTALASVWTITGVLIQRNITSLQYDHYSRFFGSMQGQKYRPPVIHRRSEG